MVRLPSPDIETARVVFGFRPCCLSSVEAVVHKEFRRVSDGEFNRNPCVRCDRRIAPRNLHTHDARLSVCWRRASEYSGVEKGLLDSVRIIEDGSVRTVVEAVFSYGFSFICQRYKLPKKGTEIEVEVRVLWNEKSKMLKLSIP